MLTGSEAKSSARTRRPTGLKRRDPELKQFWFVYQDLRVYQGLLMYQSLLIVPAELQKKKTYLSVFMKDTKASSNAER